MWGSQVAFDRAETSGGIDRLEAKGFVRRETPKTPRRARNRYLEIAEQFTPQVCWRVGPKARDQGRTETPFGGAQCAQSWRGSD